MRRNPTLSLLSLTALAAIAGVNAAELEDSLAPVIERTVPLRTHSLAAPYVDTDLQNRWWDFGGDAIINTNKHVRLTQDKPSQAGWLWARMPLSVSNWQIDVEFKVDGKANNIFGDGWAFWVTSDRAKQGPVFGSVDWFKGIGIFFDTYANSKHAYTFPRVSAMLGDGKTSYDHDRDNEGNEIGGCSENFRRRGDVPTKARLTYVKGRALQLKLQTKKSDEWKICFETNVDLPESPYIGFSAATGDVSDNHELVPFLSVCIVSVNTYSLTLKPEYRASKSNSNSKSDGKQAAMNADTNGRSGKGRREVKSGGDGWFMFILKVIGVLAFIAFAVAAVKTYNEQQKSKRHW
ncbi:lectin, mannose-binding 2 [Cryptococcus deuterogattii 99/473]|uniref:Lectin, mannose-binding 2 n=1 Tax=Cryptococcus deuterogattii Ram5 TaxID=1296110 RepID=A0A0D0VA53_9TREE|nr:lectin, mannose-binding 2 [Cryptococcus deuterogattii MMRL2647]KIR41675.1 lectin, mannose-binding 2 [Cryptococcus deuterogattii Ram5]KIR71918.1 lectin, mannose-binding 2 [Cryptococcus deuterogattii CA1014]KIY54928.1 lectin, mannose-binding 2 [Cryptococcus deuterogattii 99/473]